MTIAAELLRFVHNSVRIYFAPLTGAIKGIRAELRRVDRDARRQRKRRARRERQSTYPR